MQRFPQWIYRAGTEPDPRFSLANERTFLAWIRTSLALFAAGVVLETLAPPIHPPLRAAAAFLLILVGVLAGVQSWFGWARNERALRNATPLPGPFLAPVLTAVMLLASLLVGVGLL